MKLRLHKDKIWQQVTREGLDEAYVEVQAEKSAPSHRWTGGLISWALRDQIHAQFEAVNARHHCESQCRLFYNTQTRQWAAWFYKQTKTGMTSKEVGIGTDDPEYTQFAVDGWGEFGSWHHHCSARAFQSGTDKTDESDRPGLHITTGGIGGKEYSLHARYLFAYGGQKWFYDNVGLSQFFEVPTGWAEHPTLWNDLPQDTRDIITMRRLCAPVDKAGVFPHQWMDNMIDEPRLEVVGMRGWQPAAGGFYKTYKNHSANPNYQPYQGAAIPPRADKAECRKEVAMILSCNEDLNAAYLAEHWRDICDLHHAMKENHLDSWDMDDVILEAADQLGQPTQQALTEDEVDDDGYTVQY